MGDHQRHVQPSVAAHVGVDVDLAGLLHPLLAGHMLEVLDQDYMRTARAKGLSERTVILRHGFRNAMIHSRPSWRSTSVGCWVGPSSPRPSSSGTRWGGCSRRDGEPHPNAVCFFVVIAGFVVIANLIADLLYAVFDPRIRITD